MYSRDHFSGTAAFFDLDNTILHGDSFQCYLKYKYIIQSKGRYYLPWLLPWLVLKKCNLVTLQKAKEKALASIVGKKKNQILQEGEIFFQGFLLSRLRRKAMERLNWHRRQGHQTFIITGSPDIYIKSLARYLRLDGFECTRLAYSEGRFTGNFYGKDCLGLEKQERARLLSMRNHLDLEKSYAYSDHESDLPLLEMVGKPTAVSPSKNLNSIATDRNWDICCW